MLPRLKESWPQGALPGGGESQLITVCHYIREREREIHIIHAAMQSVSKHSI